MEVAPVVMTEEVAQRIRRNSLSSIHAKLSCYFATVIADRGDEREQIVDYLQMLANALASSTDTHVEGSFV